MTMKYKLKRGMEVMVISGSHKGKKGKLLSILRSKQAVLVEGVGLRKKYLRKSQENPEGSVIEKETPIAYSNVLSMTDIEKRKLKREGREQNKSAS